jgi:spore coat protein U-like protein
VAFGVVDVARGNDSTGEIVISCSIATQVTIALAGGGVPGARFMSGPNGGRLAYDVYPDATRSVPWSDGNGAGVGGAETSDGESAKRITVYGRGPTQSAVPHGAYGDSLTVVVTF